MDVLLRTRQTRISTGKPSADSLENKTTGHTYNTPLAEIDKK